jgi:hypothetical protein
LLLLVFRNGLSVHVLWNLRDFVDPDLFQGKEAPPLAPGQKAFPEIGAQERPDSFRSMKSGLKW